MKIRIRRRTRSVEAGSGVTITTAEGNTLISAEGGGDSDLEARVTALESDVDTINSSVATLLNDVADLQSQVFALETRLSGYSDTPLDVCEGGATVSVTFLAK